MLLPCEELSVLSESSSPKRRKPREELPESSKEQMNSSATSSDDDITRRETLPRYIPPHSRRLTRQNNESSTDSVRLQALSLLFRVTDEALLAETT